MSEAFDTWTKAGKEVFNFALFVERQLFSSASKDRDKWSENEKAIREEMNSSSSTEISDSQKSIGYKKLDRFIRDRHYDIFEKELPNQSVQYILKAVVHDIDAFFKSQAIMRIHLLLLVNRNYLIIVKASTRVS